MIPFIRKSLENGSLIAKDYTTAEWDGYDEKRMLKIRYEHRIMLEDTSTGESVLVGFFKEGDNK